MTKAPASPNFLIRLMEILSIIHYSLLIINFLLTIAPKYCKIK